MKLGYYPGCSLHSTGIEYDLSSRVVAKVLGIELEEIKDWVCCGSSPAHSSNELLSLALPAKNLAILKNENRLSEVCVPCASCYSRLKCAQARIKDPAVRQKIEEVIEGEFPDDISVMHMLDVIAYRIEPEAIRAKVKLGLNGIKVACYYGCLMTRPPKATGKTEFENPGEMEEIVKMLGAQPIDWNMRTYCCGASFALTQTAVVLELTRRILADAASSGAEAIAVGCPLCHSNLDARQGQINTKFKTNFRIPVFYFTELMGLSFGASSGDLGIDRHLTDTETFLKERGLA
jgi:heterodisulfide reductase subunit B